MSWQSTSIVPAQAARPLRYWSPAQLERARRAVDRVWCDWATRWELTAQVVAAVNACDEAAPTTLDRRMWTQAGSLWLSAGSRQAASAVCALLFAHEGDPHAPMAEALAAEAMIDLVRGLGQLAVSNGEDDRSAVAGLAPPSADLSRWSGALRIRLGLTRDEQVVAWDLHCVPSLAHVLCGGVPTISSVDRPTLTELNEAIGSQPLRFQVCLDETTLTLGTLQSLQIGDVLPLSHRLDQPLRVAAPGGPIFCAAYLGSRDHHRAVELVPAAHSLDS